jgi:hypothetical protein
MKKRTRPMGVFLALSVKDILKLLLLLYYIVKYVMSTAYRSEKSLKSLFYRLRVFRIKNDDFQCKDFIMKEMAKNKISARNAFAQSNNPSSSYGISL